MVVVGSRLRTVLEPVLPWAKEALSGTPLLITLKPQPPHEQTHKPSIYTLHEQNFGTITQILADQLDDYADLPYIMLERAFTEAVNNNVRRWSYVRAILDKWKVSGYQERSAKQIDYQPIQELTGMAPEELQGTRWQKKTKKLLENLNS